MRMMLRAVVDTEAGNEALADLQQGVSQLPADLGSTGS
jgi:hypothetical protein